MPETTTPTVRRPSNSAQERSAKDSIHIRVDGRSHPIEYLFTGAAVVAALVLNVSSSE